MPNLILASILSAILGYVFGAFPTGYYAGKLWGVDVRKHGSGRTGGTNVLRTAGWSAFTITVVGDILKGVIPVLAARLLFPDNYVAHGVALLGVLLGHNWSIWILLLAKSDPRATYAAPPVGWIQMLVKKGRGGAGVATTAGAALVLFPPAVLLIAPIMIAILIVARYASVASLSSALTYPVVMLVFALIGYAPWIYFLISILAGIIIVVVHRPNIERLRNGTERRFGQRLGKQRNV